MKYVNLRLPDDEHARMMAAADREFIPLTALLRKLFAEHERSKAVAPSVAAPKINKRDQAVLDYHDLMDDLPTVWSDAEYRRVRSAIEGLRVAGGNIPHTEMPLPRAMVDWRNVMHGGGLDPKYAGWTADQLRAELQLGYNASAQHFLTLRDQEDELGHLFDE